MALLIAAAVIVIVVFIWLRSFPKSIDSVPCSVGEQLSIHYHAHVVVIVDGKGYFPPANIGIDGPHLCFYWVHTHDTSGIVHVEAPHSFTATLGQFFDIWGQPLSRTQVWAFRPTGAHTIRFFVDRKLYAGDPRSISLRRHTSVAIEIGPPFRPPPIPVFPKGY